MQINHFLTKKSKIYWFNLCFVIIYLVFLFTAEDDYGSTLSIMYYRFFDFVNIFDIFFIIIFCFSCRNIEKETISWQSGILFFVSFLSLIVSYIYAAYKGNLFSNNGTGLKEFFIYFMCIVAYRVFTLFLRSRDQIRNLINILGVITVIYSIGLVLIFFTKKVFFYDANLITIWEGPNILFLCFFSGYFLNLYLKNKKSIISLFSFLVVAFAIVYSNRRFAMITLMGTLFMSVALTFFKNKKFTLKSGLIGFVILISLTFLFSGVLSRINPNNLLNQDSEVYLNSLSSNLDHINDIVGGWALILDNPILGLGPGAEFVSNIDGVTLATNTGIHMAFFLYWLKLGLLGFVSFILLHVFGIRASFLLWKNSNSQFNKSLGAAIFCFFLAHGVASVFGSNLLGTTKSLFLTMLILSISFKWESLVQED